MKAAIIFVFFFSAIFAQLLNIGGTTCIPDDADTCTPREGSTRVTLAGGVNVDSEGACAAGTADSDGVAVGLTIAEDGFYNVGVRGVGGFRTSGSVAVLVFAGDVAEDPCEAAVATQVGVSNSFWAAGDYNLVVTSNNGAEGACGEFGVTVSQTEYAYTGTIDTETAKISVSDFGCFVLEGTQLVSPFEFTPDAEGAYNFYGAGRLDDITTVIGAAAVSMPLTDVNLTSGAALCNASDMFVSYSIADLGYVLEEGTTYWVWLYDTATDNQMSEQPIWFNAVMMGGEPAPVAECDNLDYDDQADWMRPNVIAVSVTDECEEGTDEYYFDVRQTSFDTDQFVVVDTVGCANPDDDRSDVDGAVVLYYGAVGTPRDGDTPAVAPEDVCEDFIIAGDSGDGGAVYYWFPANEDLTIVPTTYSSGASGVYWLTIANYDIVGCVPANPYLPEPEPADYSSSLVVFAFAVVLAALF